MEIEIKQRMLEANEQAKKITLEAEKEAAETLRVTREEIKEREEKLKKTEDRLINKEELLDKRQTDLEKESENLKNKQEEVRVTKEKLALVEDQKKSELEKLSNLSAEEAKKELISVVEKQSEEDLIIRMQKLEIRNAEKRIHARTCPRSCEKYRPSMKKMWSINLNLCMIKALMKNKTQTILRKKSLTA